MLKLLNTPAARLDEANSYIAVILAFIIVPMLYNLEAVILRSLGDSKTPLYFLIFSSVLNIVLDYVFIKFTNMGVMGAAVATVLAQFLSVVFCFIVILKNFKIIKLSKEDFRFSSALFKNMMGAGMTMAIMNSIFLSAQSLCRARLMRSVTILLLLTSVQGKLRKCLCSRL